MTVPRQDRRRRLGDAVGWSQRVLRRGWYWGADYRWVAGAIGRGLINVTVPHSYDHGTLRPVLLIPGVLEEWTLMRPVADRLNAAGHPIYVLPELKNNTVTVEAASAIASQALIALDLREVVIVAHSKGGLIAKHLLLDEVGERIRQVVAIATPFAGSSLAWLVPLRVIRSLGPDDATIRSLAARSEVNHLITSVYPSFDPHIPGGSELAGATNLQVEAIGHFRILKDPDLLDAVVAAAAG